MSSTTKRFYGFSHEIKNNKKLLFDWKIEKVCSGSVSNHTYLMNQKVLVQHKEMKSLEKRKKEKKKDNQDASCISRVS